MEPPKPFSVAIVANPNPPTPLAVRPPPIPTGVILHYYDLPAGVMANLVSLNDRDYTPIDPALVILPKPEPPSERLLKAAEEFYAPSKR